MCRQEALDNINMLLQDPRPLEDKRDELAKVNTMHLRNPKGYSKNLSPQLMRSGVLVACVHTRQGS